MDEHVDAVVVGAGLGGLAAAVTVAGAGRRVVVLEQHTLPGGYAQTFQRGPFRFDASLHALNGLVPGGGVDPLYRGLGIAQRLHLERLDPLYVVRYPEHEVVAHADPFRYESELIRHFPDQLTGIRGFFDEMHGVLRDARRLDEDGAAGRSALEAEYPARYPDLMRVGGQTWEQAMARHLGDTRARAVVASLWTYAALPPSRCAALVGLGLTGSFHEYGGWYPHGGSQAVAWALEAVLGERGGEVRYAQTVTGIELADGRAGAVCTEQGLRLAAEVVVSNASAPATLLEMVGGQYLSDDYVTQVATPPLSCASLVVYLGLDDDVFARHDLPHELFLIPSYEPDAGWQAIQAGDWKQVPLSVTDYTQVDPGCAPPGGGVVVISSLAGWDYADVWGTGGDLTNYHQNPRYVALKEQAADTLVERAAEHIPGLTAAIRHREAATPLSNFTYTRNPRGAIEGYENCVAASGPGWLPQHTPVPNLFLAGAWTNGGGQIPAIMSGAGAGSLALQALAKMPSPTRSRRSTL